MYNRTNKPRSTSGSSKFAGKKSASSASHSSTSHSPARARAHTEHSTRIYTSGPTEASSYGSRPSRSAYGTSSVRAPRSSSFAPRSSSFGDRPAYGSKPAYGRTPFSSSAPRTEGSAGRSSFGSRSSFSSRPSFGSRPSYGGGFGGSSYGGSSYGSRSSYGGRPSFGGSRGGYGGRSGRSSFNTKIDVSRYINKDVKQEVVKPYVPHHAFADFEIEEHMKENLIKKGYVTPTPIQDKAIPEILKGNDVVGIANTGTGKTAAFLIPLINKVILNKNEQVLVVAPTRELAIQIDDELKMFAKGTGLYAVCCVGGSPIGKQLRELREFNHFIIGTPGRIKDLIERKALDLSKCKNVVLDEADRMLDMGFINDMHYFMKKMSVDRQTLFFSATLSPEVEKLIKDFLKDPVRVSVKTGDTSKNIEQDVVRIKPGENKMDVLHDLLTKDGFEKVLVFGKTKHGVERLSETLTKKGISAVSIHGNKNQGQRQRALELFKNNKAKVMVATDVAARGLDIPNVTHVINFDVPSTHEDYIHRIGRTGRGDKKGKAFTFVD